MRTRIAGLPGLLVAAMAAGSPPAAAGPPDDPLRPVPGPARPAEFVTAVNAAIEKGVAYLRRVQDKGGGFLGGGAFDPAAPAAYPLGTTALGLYTLRSCGVPADDPAAASALRRIRQVWNARRRTVGESGVTNYEVSLALLALEAHYAPSDPDPGADRAGGRPAAKRDIPDADLAWIRDMARWVSGAQCGNGGFGYGSPGSLANWEDHSNTQFSLLGLKAARRCGVEVPKAVFRRALDHLLEVQETNGPAVTRRETGDPPAADGKGRPYGTNSRAVAKDRARGWGYRDSSRRAASGSMTTGGVSSLVICRGELLGSDRHGEEKDRIAVQAIRDGIAWLGHHFTVTTNPGSGGSNWHFYYLYGLERAGVLAGVTWMGDHDWYLEGARRLVREQSERGGWGGGFRLPGAGRAGSEDLLDTCFALLFLKKATFRVEGAVATEESDGDLDLSRAADLDEVSFRSVFDTVLARFARADAAGRAERAADFVAMGTRALGLLVLGLEAEGEADRAAALDALRRVTGLTQGFDAAAAPEVRAVAVAAWEEWYLARRRGLVPDVSAGRFRER